MNDIKGSVAILLALIYATAFVVEKTGDACYSRLPVVRKTLK